MAFELGLDSASKLVPIAHCARNDAMLSVGSDEMASAEREERRERGR